MKDKILDFVTISSDRRPGYGDGSGSDSGFGRGYGYGSGYGGGKGSGKGYGYGNGDGVGSGKGSGYGDGYGVGSYEGEGSAYGSGYSYMCVVSRFNGKNIHFIGCRPTIIYRVRRGFAFGYVIGDDLTLTKCVVAKHGSVFAHGKTIREASEALQKKLFFDDISVGITNVLIDSSLDVK